MENRHLSEEQKRTIEESVRNILAALGDDPDREGLVDTPERVARMYDEVFEGMRYTNEEIARMFDRCFLRRDGFSEKYGCIQLLRASSGADV